MHSNLTKHHTASLLYYQLSPVLGLPGPCLGLFHFLIHLHMSSFKIEALFEAEEKCTFSWLCNSVNDQMPFSKWWWVYSCLRMTLHLHQQCLWAHEIYDTKFRRPLAAKFLVDFVFCAFRVIRPWKVAWETLIPSEEKRVTLLTDIHKQVP